MIVEDHAVSREAVIFADAKRRDIDRDVNLWQEDRVALRVEVAPDQHVIVVGPRGSAGELASDAAAVAKLGPYVQSFYSSYEREGIVLLDDDWKPART